MPEEPVKIYTAYDPPPKNGLGGFEPTRTRQSEAGATDINQIMKKYEKTGMLPLSTRQAFFADVTGLVDYRTAIDRVRAAESAFMQLPADLRSRFDNDAATFLDWAALPDNAAELAELGLSPEGVETEESSVKGTVVPGSEEPGAAVPE